MREADRVFSLWIRARDGNKCVQCGSTNQPTNGHVVSRGKKNTLFDEMNCYCQCWPDNYAHRWHPERYHAWYVGKYGMSSFLALVERSRIIKQWKSYELEEIIRRYRA